MVSATVAFEVNAERERQANRQEPFSLDAFMHNPPDHMEWVDGQLVEKAAVSLEHSEIILNLGSQWRSYALSSNAGGKVYVDVPCKTAKQGRRPDVAYITADLLKQYGKVVVLPQSFPLVAEVVSPTDAAEMIFAKAQEYLDSGCEEVWLIFPENRYIFVITHSQRLWFAAGETIQTQIVLPGFSVAVAALLVGDE